jgi:hypothetical protein
MESGENKMKVWLKRFGVAGFLFFTIKGLLWLIVPAALVWWGVR